MRRILGSALLSVLFSATVMAAQNSQTFYLATAARAGNIELPRGIYEVTWSAPSKSRVTLTIKTENVEEGHMHAAYGGTNLVGSKFRFVGEDVTTGEATRSA